MRAVLDIVIIVLDLYVWLLIAAAILSWLIAFNVVNTRNGFVAAVAEFLYRITEPLLAPIEGQAWRLLWSSEAPLYGGSGGPAQDAVGDWLISGQSATVLTPGPSVTIPEAKNVFHLREANG